ncbi:MAG: hypothetical protein JNJ58_01200 [Chitinophagaceae bacterium]|nr:hypothetical protein [Chitinophagaceae bacterium]
MKIATSIAVLFTLTALIFSACKDTNNDKYFYNPDRDTIRPQIAVTTPLLNDIFSYGEDVHFVGTITDLQSEGKTGKLLSFHMVVEQLNATKDTVVKTLLNKYPVVDGKDGYTFNEKIVIPVGSGVTNCIMKAWVTDYASKKDSVSISFTIQ